VKAKVKVNKIKAPFKGRDGSFFLYMGKAIERKKSNKMPTERN